jgi:hypothetical protein
VRTVAIDAVIVDYLKHLRMGGLAAGYREILRIRGVSTLTKLTP